MKNKDLSSKVLVSLLTMSCVYLGGISALATVAAAENDPDNTVGKVITVGDSLSGGDVFNFKGSGSNNTALRVYGENLNIPMTGSGVYTINGNGASGITGMKFSSTESVSTGWGNSESFIRAVGVINGDWKLNLQAGGTAYGVVIDGGTKYTKPGSMDSIDDASDITFTGKVNIDIEGNGVNAVQLKGGSKGAFKDDVTVTGTNNGNNALYGTQINSSSAVFEKNLTLNLQNNSTQQGSNPGYGIKLLGNDSSVMVKGKTTITINSAGQYITGIDFSGSGNKGEFGDTEILLTGGSQHKGINISGGQADFNGDTKISVGNYSAGTGSRTATALNSISGGIINVNQNKNKTVQIKGHFVSTSDGVINVVLNNAQSWWEGDAQLNASGKAINVELANGAVWYPGCGIEIHNKGLNLNLHDNGIVDMTKTASKYDNLTIGSLNGSGGMFRLETDVVNMQSDKVYIEATTDVGKHRLDIIDVNEVTMDQIAADAGKGLLLATAPDAIKFAANDREQTLFYVRYNLKEEALGTGMTEWKLDGFEIVKEDPDSPDLKPTTSIDTILSANALNYHTWRTENDKLLKRMGELRYNGEQEKGAWFRVQGSKIGREGQFDFSNKYTTYQLGYDELTKYTDSVKRYQGFALSYTDGSSGYSSGSGDNSSKAISFYNTEIGSKGHYLDFVFKISNMDNDFAVYDSNSNKITGDFNNTGVALSAEYGRKNDFDNGWYIEPQAQFTLGYLGGDNYTASNGIEVSQSGIKSAVGRIGFNIGKAVGSKGVVYAKANLLHEFGGGYEVAMQDSSGAVTVSDSFSDTWFEYGIGAALQTGKNNHIYFDVERSRGSDFKKDWQWNVGARWNF
ncbi:autotransporter outer membrane beta-barrel domain-containing protein [uncultured Phascolarctobacterium sp.]|uniref:autotransporter family protein n=1 Tax=uncultured Phascolarctobacterium sp. TaxID=512296 RepID=UPI002601D547|nr:autotransporter outer membrane beta-barrel domain-containing protein [uncultured Phascolarctobacterium sp.]